MDSMREFLASRKPTPAMAVAFIALLAALSGTAVALPGTNSVDSGDIKNRQVKGKDLANNAVTGAKVKNSAIRSADVGNDSLTGTDVNESTLGKVPSAANADNATNATNASNATNANTVGGKTASDLDQPRAFARIEVAADVDEANTSGLTDADVTSGGTGLYCYELGFTPRHIQATVDWISGGADAVIHGHVGAYAGCPAGNDASARIVDASTGTAVDRDHFVTFVD
jgi:hypothetical protein